MTPKDKTEASSDILTCARPKETNDIGSEDLSTILLTRDFDPSKVISIENVVSISRSKKKKQNFSNPPKMGA